MAGESGGKGAKHYLLATQSTPRVAGGDRGRDNGYGQERHIPLILSTRLRRDRVFPFDETSSIW